MPQAPPSTETATLLFTDLVGSTELMARLGSGADDVRRDHFALLQARVERSGGRVVKTLGDGVMAVFGSASAALDCAVSVQRGVARGDARLSVRVGLAAGDVMVETATASARRSWRAHACARSRRAAR